MTEPTDAELSELADAHTPNTETGSLNYQTYARAVLAKWGTPPAVAGEPVAWQSRMRPTWGNNTTPWTQWEPCTKGQAEDYWKTNLLHDWAFEARALYTTPQPTRAQAGAVPLTYQQVIASWNAQADEHNKWDALGEDEKIEWAVACAKAAPPAAVDPLTDEQIQEAILPINPHGMGYFLRIARAIERAHGIGIKKGDSHG